MPFDALAAFKGNHSNIKTTLRYMSKLTAYGAVVPGTFGSVFAFGPRILVWLLGGSFS